MDMEEIKKIVDDMGIDAFENSMNLAAIAVVSDSGNLIYQTENWDLTNQTTIIFDVLNGGTSFNLNNADYTVHESSSNGIIANHISGMGFILMIPFQGGILLSYAIPQADPPRCLTFMKGYAFKLNGLL
jgi:hypothetical protein